MFLKKSLRIIPQLTNTMHKGEAGRIVVVGGSEEYTGAPYFAGMAALRTGADLATVVCSQEAAIAIKSYSPDLMVCPYLKTEGDLKRCAESPEKIMQSIVEKTSGLLARSHALLVGPGLSRDKFMQRACKAIVFEARRLEMPIILDGDALTMVAESPECVSHYRLAFLTPNFNELKKMCESILQKKIDSHSQGLELAGELSERLGNICIACKSSTDQIANGKSIIPVKEAEMAPRRCGGQGDILAGSLTTFVNWARRFELANNLSETSSTHYVDSIHNACVLVRHAAKVAYGKHGRGLLASEILSEVSSSFDYLYSQSQ